MTDFKECKAWAVVDSDGNPVVAPVGSYLIANDEQRAKDMYRIDWFNQSVVRVRIVREEG